MHKASSTSLVKTQLLVFMYTDYYVDHTLHKLVGSSYETVSITVKPGKKINNSRNGNTSLIPIQNNQCMLMAAWLTSTVCVYQMLPLYFALGSLWLHRMAVGAVGLHIVLGEQHWS